MSVHAINALSFLKLDRKPIDNDYVLALLNVNGKKKMFCIGKVISVVQSDNEETEH